MDLADIFRKGLQDIHKDLLNKNYKKRSLLSRKESLMNARRQTRDTLMFNKRQIAADISPYITPTSNTKKMTVRPEALKPKNNEEINKRFEMLKQWKDKRNKQKEAAKKLAKPIFKVCHVDRNIGLPNLENVNKQIKGKQIKPIGTPTIKSFAPVNHKFQPPTNIKPIQIIQSKNAQLLKNTSEKPQILKKPVKPQPKVEVKNIKSKSDVRMGQSHLKQKSSGYLVKNISTTNNARNVTKLNNTNSSKAVKMNGSPRNEKERDKTSQKNKNSSVNVIGFETHNLPSSSKIDCDKKSSTSLKVNTNTKKTKEIHKTYATPKSKRSLKATPLFTSENSSTIEQNKEKEDIIIDDNDDFEIENVIIYDDEEITLKTPVKKYRKSSHISSVSRSGKNTEKFVQDGKDSNVTVDKIITPLSKHVTPRVDRSLKEDKKNLSADIKDMFKSKTPRKSINKTELSTPVYISPFVTISRGKDSARKEYNQRKSTGGTFIPSPDSKDFCKSTSPQAGADYFEKILDDQISRIQSICEIWMGYKHGNNLSDEAIDLIDVATGQSNLLITKKFEQFRDLIAQCRLSDFKDKPVTCEDLHGFWDMIYQQVIDLDKRFANLEKMKNNNWEAVIPEKKIVQTRKRGRPKKNKTSASSSLKDIIKAARNRRKNDDPHVQLLEQKTPESYKMLSPIRTNSARRSLRVSLLRGQSIKRLSSPGLTMMKITQSIKTGDGVTPSKSILKTDVSRSARRHTKSVLFVDDLEDISRNVDFDKENKENCATNANISICEEVQRKNNLTPIRRSKRLSKLLS